MHDLLNKITIPVTDKLYLKNPESSELGKKILMGSIAMLDEIGFECFTFKKLACEIGSTEASVYRYFENKHRLLLYLTAWYWGWMEWQLVFSIANIKSPNERLDIAITQLTKSVEEDRTFGHIDEVKLNRIVNEESAKAYMTKEVDAENKEGVFIGYKRLVQRVSDIILEIKPSYKYPHMLVSTVMEGAHHQRFFAEHLPKLTDIVKGEDSITEFYKSMVTKTLAD